MTNPDPTQLALYPPDHVEFITRMEAGHRKPGDSDPNVHVKRVKEKLQKDKEQPESNGEGDQ